MDLTSNINKKGEFVRSESQFRDWITADGSSGFKSEPGRYHLYVSLACPWAHRTLVVRALKGLEEVITVDVVHPFNDSNGWSFNSQYEGSTGDTVNQFQFLKEVYFQSQPNYSGRFTVPVLYDKQNKVIVNNESPEIIIMLNNEFNEFAKHPELDLYPVELREKIEAINTPIFNNVNNGVYKCGFAKSQEAYNGAFENLFNYLDVLENILNENRYLVGNRLTLADIRLWTTLLRFDSVYYVHFKCNKRLISSYENLWGFTRELYQIPKVSSTVNMAQIKCHYYTSHVHLNPSQIIPLGPQIDFEAPHHRENK